MSHAGAELRGEDVATRGLEELQHRVILKRGRVRHIDHHLGAGKRFGQSAAGDGVDAGCR
jgi:hypothetical protein